jgi:hypothetical protein
MLDCQPPIQVLAELEVGSVASDPLQAGALPTGLRFFCIAGWGWVAEIGGRIAGSAPSGKNRHQFHERKHTSLVLLAGESS